MYHSLNSQLDVVHVIGAFAAGGAERFVVDLVRALGASGMSVGLLVLSSRRDAAGAQMVAALEAAGIRFECGPTERVGIRSALWYLGRIRKIRPKIVHLHTQNTEVAHFLACKLYRVQHEIFRTVHSTNSSPDRLHWIAIRGNSAVLSIACSEPVMEKFESVISGKIVTIRNGITFDWPIQTAETYERCRTQLGLERGCYHFVNVGRMGGDSLENAAKAHDVLINAWKRGRLGDRACILNFLGDGNLRPQLEQLATGDRSIVFHGIRDNVHEWLLAADCFVMPSRYEGLPIAAVEAVGTGLPCVFTDIPPLRELDAPVVAWVPVDGIEPLMDALDAMLVERPQVPESATAEFRSRFGIDGTAATYRDYYLTRRPS
jgi:glycosyltransferase involved in cell wall biosynthesis